MATAITATPNIRTITRDSQPVVQQMYLVTFDAGTAKERVQRVWLDTDHPMFSGVEMPNEEQARKQVEELSKGKDFRILR